jgi:ABC-type antimicrobial peptide transport system permease subunit
LHEGTNIAALSSKTEHDIQTKNEFIKFEISLKPLKYTYLQETNGKTKVIIFLAIAILILLVACINSINLITGQYFNNLKGIGLRKVIGANKLQLIKQTITETFFHAFIAIILALVFVKIAIGFFNNLSNESLNLSLIDPVVIAGLFAILLVTTLITGLFPAFLISSFKPVNILKNKLNYRFSNGSVGASFIVFQFVVTIFFIITVLTLKKQNNLVDAFHLGYNKTNIVYVRLDGDIKQNIPVVKEELLKSPLIKSVTVTSELPGNVYSGSYFDWGIDEIKAQRICELEVDRDFIKTLDIQMAAGSFFKEDNETNSIIVNQSVIKAINEIDPIGKIFKYRGKPYTLIGVLKDFQHGSPLNLNISPMVFRLKPEDNNYLLIKTNPSGNNVFSGQEAMSFIKKTCESYSVEWPLQYQYLDDFAPAAEKLFISRNKLITLSTFVVILISCFGLLGLVILSASQKTKEIGIRKVNGAKVIEVMAMLNSDFIKWVSIAFVIASPIAWYAMNKWLQNFAYKTELSWWVFAVAGAVAVVVAVLTVSWQSWRAATRNPVEALRYE